VKPKPDMLRHARGCRTEVIYILLNENGVGNPTEGGESPVLVRRDIEFGILSRGGPEEPPSNPAAPSAKAKYSW
jgi:hypothetical protein